MRALVNTRPGGTDVLAIKEMAMPLVGEHDVLIRVRAAGLNFADIVARTGMYQDAPPFPCVLGYEVAGTVEGLGTQVTDLMPGQRVLALCRFGGQAEFVSVPAAQVMPLPDRLSFEEGAAIPVNYLTAWHCLVWLGNLHRGEQVLVHSAGGGVGIAALQVCRLFGAESIGTASASKHEILRTYGLQHAIDYNTQDFEDEVRRLTNGRGVHHVLDAVGGSSFRKSYRSLRKTGRLYCFGNSTMTQGSRKSILRALLSVFSMPFFHPLRLMMSNRGVFGVNLGQLWDEIDMLRQQFSEIMRHMETGALQPVVARAFPLEEAAQAHQYIQARQNLGKVVLCP